MYLLLRFDAGSLVGLDPPKHQRVMFYIICTWIVNERDVYLHVSCRTDVLSENPTDLLRELTK